MRNDRSQNQVPHDHNSGITPDSALNLEVASLDLEAALGEIAERTNGGAEPKSVLATGPETFNVSDEVEGTIITDTKRDTWRFSDAVKRSLRKWVTRKERVIKRTFTDKTIATKKIASVRTRADTVRKAATNVAPGDGVSSLRKTPQVTNRVLRATPVSSIRVKPKDVPSEIGDTKPHWKYIIVEADEDMAPAAVKQVTRNAPAALLEAPELPLLAPATITKTPIVTAREYRTSTTKFVSTTTPKPVPSPATPTPPPVESMVVPVPAAITKLAVPTAPIVLNPPSSTQPDATFERLADGGNEVVTRLPVEGKPAPSAEYPEVATEGKPRRFFERVRLSTTALIVLFVAIVMVSNAAWLWLGKDASDTTPALVSEKTIFDEQVIMTADDAASFLSQIVSAEHTGNVSYRFRTSNGDTFPARNLIPQFSGATHVELGSIADAKFVLVQYPDYATALGIMLQAESSLDTSLKMIFAVSTRYQFLDRIIDGAAARVAVEQNADVLLYHVTPDGTIILTNTQSSLLLLIVTLK